MRGTSIVVVLVSFLVWRQGRVLWNSLVFPGALPPSYYVSGQQTEKCRRVVDPSHELNFCEDAVFWDVHGERRILASCDPGRLQWNTVMGPLRDPSPRGALWAYTNGTQLTKLVLDNYPEHLDFHPLGLDIWQNGPQEPSNLFVINHGRHYSTIEFFKLPADTLPFRAIYVRTLRLPTFLSPNSLAATGAQSFFLTQDHLLTRRLPSLLGHVFPLLETVLGLPLSWVNHVDFTGELSSAVKAWGIPFANGIALSPDGKEVAVASTSMSRVLFYERLGSNQDLRFKYAVDVPFSPDNLSFDDEDLVVAGHPHFPSIIAVAKGKTNVAPSWVVRLIRRRNITIDLAPLAASSRVSLSTTHNIQTLYQSDGSGFSTSSTGLLDKKRGKMYMVGLYAEGLLECDI